LAALPALWPFNKRDEELLCNNFRGGVPGVDVMAKGPQGWVQCEGHLPYYPGTKINLTA
jgi:hypothetical protein